MKTSPRLITLLITLQFLLNNFILFAQETSSIYQQAKILYEKSNFDEAINLFKKSGRDEDNAEAYYMASKILSQDTTLNSYMTSRENINEAIKLDPNNIKYRMHLAELLKVLFRINVFDKDAISRMIIEYEKVIELDSTNSEAHFKLAKILERKFYEYYGSEEVRLDYKRKKDKPHLYKSDNVTDKYNEYINELFEEGNYASLKMTPASIDLLKSSSFHFLKAFEYDKSSLNSIIKSSLTQFYSGNIESAIKIINKGNKLFSRDYNFQLTKAFLYFQNSDFEESKHFYDNAFFLMDDNLRNEYKIQSVLNTMDNNLRERIINLSPQIQKDYIDYYWSIKDPLLLTPINERILEHYSRVFYAKYFLQNFDEYIHGHGEVEENGLKTERGLVHLRYGKPIQFKRLRPVMTTSNKSLVKTDYWDYGDFKISFNDMTNRKNYRIGNFDFGDINGHYSGDPKTIYDEMVSIKSERYIPEYKKPLEAVYNFTQFKGDKNTDLYVNYGFPIINENPNTHKFGLFFSNEKYEIYKNKVDEVILPDKNEYNTKINNEEYYFHSISNNVLPQKTKIALELIRNADEAVFTAKGMITTKDYSENKFQISDLLLGVQLEMNKKIPNGITRKNVSVLPNPTKYFDKKTPLILYCELYNLAKEDNLTNFEQRITIVENSENAIPKVLNSFFDVIGFDTKGNKITLASEYSTIESDPQLYVQLDLSNFESGDYLIDVTIIDNISEETISSKTNVIWKNE